MLKEHDMHIEPKSYKLKFLGKLVVQHGVKALQFFSISPPSHTPQFANLYMISLHMCV